MSKLIAIILFLMYAAVSFFLCMAAITNPHLSDTVQWLWCAAAVGWGPIILVIVLEAEYNR